MIEGLEDYTWVSIPSCTVKDLEGILSSVEISRYATGGVSSSNKGIKDTIGDCGFWDKFIYHQGVWRLGSINEGTLPEKEIHPLHMIGEY